MYYNFNHAEINRQIALRDERKTSQGGSTNPRYLCTHFDLFQLFKSEMDAFFSIIAVNCHTRIP